MATTPRRLAAALAAVVLAAAGGGYAATAPASAVTTSAVDYTVTVGATGSWTRPDDTPAGIYINKNGTFYYQQSHALYGASDPRKWSFYTGTNFDTATRSPISDAVNPANPKDKNNDTTWRCNNSPTGQESTYAPAGSGYSQKNYCDLAGVWVDPDTGDLYGLVHNEFTPQPFGDRLHYDGLDYAVSKDQGRTWTIKGHIITSPYSTKRGDDTASGYFYVYYGSRIVDKGGGWKAFHGHVARAPISGKMAPESWKKWYDGSWNEPGTGGRESNMVPVDSSSDTGYTPPSREYDPANPGTVDEQVAAGKTPPTSPLFVMDITYNAYLGLYIGEPQAVDQSGNAPQQFYATKDLSKQKWELIGDTGKYTNASWYRWFLDSKSKTSSAIIGKDFRSYCSFGCSGGSSAEYINIAITSSASAAPIAPAKAYRIANGDGRVLAQDSRSSAATSLAAPGSGQDTWKFSANGDGSYTITNTSTRQLLGVDSSSTRNRAWGTKPTVAAAGPNGPSVGQQWFVIPGTSGTYRLVNRYSGLVLGISADSGRLAETTPVRFWTNTTGKPGGSRTAAEQTLTLTPARAQPAP